MIIACSCAVGGCVQGPNYQKPEVAVPPAYRYGNAIPSLGLAGYQSGWLAFGDPQLNALVAECLENNRDLRVATARVDEFAAILAGTRSQAFPQVGYALGGTRQRASERGAV
ncbi:MAG: hypothetical protein ACJ8EY_09135, partial [Sphingomicrobium sp.]